MGAVGVELSVEMREEGGWGEGDEVEEGVGG